jgi:hypothetical protein
VLTISNEITASPRESPVAVDRRKVRSVGLFHLSWWRVITEAIVQHRCRGIDDPDQAWILGELINCGARRLHEFEDGDDSYPPQTRSISAHSPPLDTAEAALRGTR